MPAVPPDFEGSAARTDMVSFNPASNASVEQASGSKQDRWGTRPFMLSVESWPEPAARAWKLAHRFQKFLAVGAVGLGVNQGLLFFLHDVFQLRLSLASPLAIFFSMIVTFTLNERWTWHDRGRGRVLQRMAMYFPINFIGLLINFSVLSVLVHEFDVHYLIANLFGAGIAAVWNFAVNHRVTWRE